MLPAAARVRGSPYKTARVDGIGSLKTSKRPQRIAVVAYRRPRQVIYALVAFFNRKVPATFFEPTFRRILRSFRAQPPLSGRAGPDRRRRSWSARYRARLRPPLDRLTAPRQPVEHGHDPRHLEALLAHALDRGDRRAARGHDVLDYEAALARL